MKRAIKFRNKYFKESAGYVRFITAVAMFGFSSAVYNTIFNNFLSESFNMGNLERGVLELPREMPGLLVVFISMLFFFLPPRKLAAFSHLLAAIGLYLIGHYSVSFSMMLVWLFLYSTGQHLFLPLSTAIGMEFAHDGKTGKSLGKLNAISNFAAIAGSSVVFFGFKYFKFNFSISYTFASMALVISSILLFTLKSEKTQKRETRFILRKEYKLFYWLSILFGTRKQIFLTFAPWVIVTVYGKSTSVVATLMTAAGLIGIIFNPLLGRAVDRFGERFVLMSEAALLIIVCLGYGFAKILFSDSVAFVIASVCYMADQLLLYVSMARSTYLKKIALHPSEVNPSLTMGVTIDHFFSIVIALVSGVIWIKLGYQYVFLAGAVIAIVNLVSAAQIKIKKTG